MTQRTGARGRALATLSALVLVALGAMAAPAGAANTTITGGPPSPTNSTSASFTFTSSDSLARYVCSLDGGAWSLCLSPKSYSGLTDGTHTFRVGLANETGTAPKEDWDSRSWVVDTAAPAVTLTSPTAGAVFTTTNRPTLSGAAGAATGDGAQVTVKVYAGTSASGTPAQTLTATRSGTSWSVTPAAGLPDGTYTARAEQSDAAGNTGLSASRTFTVDLNAPVVTLTSPAPSAVLTTARPTFAGAAGNFAGDSTQVTVKIYAGTSASGTPVQTLTATRSGTSWSVTPLTGLSDGTYTARAEQSDAAGHVGFSDPRTFSIDATAPAVTLTSPAAGALLTTGRPTFSGAAGAAAGDSSEVKVKVYAGTSASGTPVQTLTTTRSGTSWSVAPASALPDGTYTARAEQSDSAGNTGQSSAVTFSVDATAPAVTLTSPAAGAVLASDRPAFSGTAGSAAGDGAQVTVKVYAGTSASGTPVQTLTATRSGASWSVTAAAGLPDGTYTARAEQSDAAGNVGQSASRTFRVDTMAPTVTLTQPGQGETVDTSVPTFEGTAGADTGDSAQVTVKIYSGASASGTPVRTLSATRSGTSWSVTPSSALPNATYTARAEQTDAAGHVGQSNTRTFTVALTGCGSSSAVTVGRGHVLGSGNFVSVKAEPESNLNRVNVCWHAKTASTNQAGVIRFTNASLGSVGLPEVDERADQCPSGAGYDVTRVTVVGGAIEIVRRTDNGVAWVCVRTPVGLGYRLKLTVPFGVVPGVEVMPSANPPSSPTPTAWPNKGSNRCTSETGTFLVNYQVLSTRVWLATRTSGTTAEVCVRTEDPAAPGIGGVVSIVPSNLNQQVGTSSDLSPCDRQNPIASVERDPLYLFVTKSPTSDPQSVCVETPFENLRAYVGVTGATGVVTFTPDT